MAGRQPQHPLCDQDHNDPGELLEREEYLSRVGQERIHAA